MDQAASTADAEATPRERAKALILNGLGAKRVATWCGVAVDTVYQWLARATDDEPFPPARVPAVIAGARAEGLDAPMGVRWPAMADVQP